MKYLQIFLLLTCATCISSIQASAGTETTCAQKPKTKTSFLQEAKEVAKIFATRIAFSIASYFIVENICPQVEAFVLNWPRAKFNFSAFSNWKTTALLGAPCGALLAEASRADSWPKLSAKDLLIPELVLMGIIVGYGIVAASSTCNHIRTNPKNNHFVSIILSPMYKNYRDHIEFAALFIEIFGVMGIFTYILAKRYWLSRKKTVNSTDPAHCCQSTQ